jgi:hypothetical protein
MSIIYIYYMIWVQCCSILYIIHYNILDVYGRGVLLLLLLYIRFYDGLIHG